LVRNRTHSHAAQDRAAVEFFQAKVTDAAFFADRYRLIVDC
jgi:hypothetical protein